MGAFESIRIVLLFAVVGVAVQLSELQGFVDDRFSPLALVVAMPKASPANSKAATPSVSDVRADQPVPEVSATHDASAASSAPETDALPLNQLNKRSAHFGRWPIVVQHACAEEYACSWNGRQRVGSTLFARFRVSEEPVPRLHGPD